jgi:hypothetical protein
MRRIISSAIVLAASMTTIVAVAAPASAANPICFHSTRIYSVDGFETSWPFSTSVNNPNDNCENKFGDPPSPGFSLNFAVQALQRDLNHCYNKSLSEDGQFGNNTYNAVRSVQSSLGLTADGWAGPNTHHAMKHWNAYTGCRYAPAWVETVHE